MEDWVKSASTVGSPDKPKASRLNTNEESKAPKLTTDGIPKAANPFKNDDPNAYISLLELPGIASVKTAGTESTVLDTAQTEKTAVRNPEGQPGVSAPFSPLPPRLPYGKLSIGANVVGKLNTMLNTPNEKLKTHAQKPGPEAYTCVPMRICSSQKIHPERDAADMVDRIKWVANTIRMACVSQGKLLKDLDEEVIYSEDPGECDPFYVEMGNDRASMSLYKPLRGLATDLERYKLMIENRALRARFLKQATIPFIKIQSKHTKTTKRKAICLIHDALHDNGVVDEAYIQTFEWFVCCLDTPIDQLHQLQKLLKSICDESMTDDEPTEIDGQILTNSKNYRHNSGSTDSQEGQVPSESETPGDDPYRYSHNVDEHHTDKTIDLTCHSPHYSPGPDDGASTSVLSSKMITLNFSNYNPLAAQRPTPFSKDSRPYFINNLDEHAFPINNIHITPRDWTVFCTSLGLVKKALAKATECVVLANESKILAEECLPCFLQWEEQLRRWMDELSEEAAESSVSSNWVRDKEAQGSGDEGEDEGKESPRKEREGYLEAYGS